MRIQLETIKQAAAIIEASVKPIEAISDMKVINVGGLNDFVGNNANLNSSVNSSNNMSDQLVNSLLKYRGLAPVVDNIFMRLV